MVTIARTPEKATDASGKASSAPARLMSLDIFRGVTIAAMILVNDPGDWHAVYWPLRHSEWSGWTPTDLVFPFFLFIVGVAMAFSFSTRLQRGDSRPKLFGHVLFRGLVLFALGVFLNGFPNHYDPAHLRVYGVLQRIAICYVVVSVFELWTGWRAQLTAAIACLVGYWVLMRYLPVPGYGIPTHGIPLLDPDRNLVAWLDRKLLIGHLYERTRDPEGLLSTIPAVATCIAGLLTGKWLKSSKTASVKALAMVAAGFAAIILGEVANVWFPINKKLWTSSYVLLTAGLALIGLALCYWLVDVKQHRGPWTTPILVFGRNAIAAYFLSEALAAALWTISWHTAQGRVITLQGSLYSRIFAPIANPLNASLLYATAYVCVCWAAMSLLHKNEIFLKV